MNAQELAAAVQLASPHVIAVALCSVRLLPVVLLCPIFGGMHAPMTVRLGLVLTLSCSLHFAGGITAPAVDDAWVFLSVAVKEVAFGISLGLIASLPFDAARIGGRFIDLSRGTSAEAVLPQSGTRESATGEGLHQLLIAVAVSGPAFGLILGALWRTFAVVRLGAFEASEAQALRITELAGAAMTTGLAIGAPIAACTLAIDLVLGLASRANPQAGAQELSAPLRILAGGALLWLGLGVLAQRLMGDLVSAPGAVDALTALQNG